MTWIETTSLTFTARHEDADTTYAEDLLDRLEDLSLKLEDRFEVVPGDITVMSPGTTSKRSSSFRLRSSSRSSRLSAYAVSPSSCLAVKVREVVSIQVIRLSVWPG